MRSTRSTETSHQESNTFAQLTHWLNAAHAQTAGCDVVWQQRNDWKTGWRCLAQVKWLRLATNHLHLLGTWRLWEPAVCAARGCAAGLSCRRSEGEVPRLRPQRAARQRETRLRLGVRSQHYGSAQLAFSALVCGDVHAACLWIHLHLQAAGSLYRQHEIQRGVHRQPRDNASPASSRRAGGCWQIWRGVVPCWTSPLLPAPAASPTQVRHASVQTRPRIYMWHLYLYVFADWFRAVWPLSTVRPSEFTVE